MRPDSRLETQNSKRKSPGRRVKRAIIPLGALTGALLVLSLPKPDLYPLAWIALVPLLSVIARATSMTEVVLSSYIGGVIFFAGSCYWITETMNIFGGLSMPVAVGMGALFALLFGLYVLLFGLGLRLAVERFGSRGLFFAAPLWVTVELLRSVLFSGFPWMLSGYALVPYAGILQIATWTGVYGLSFLATAVNSAIAYGISRRSTRWIAAALAAILAVVLLPVFGARTVNDPLAVRLVQTNISIDQSWKKPESDALMNEVSALSVQDGIKPRLVVWPETPAPFYLTEDAEFRTRMQNIARKLGAYFLIGYIDAVGEGPANSAGLLNPMGEQISRYDKMHLVPFGEYVPFKRLLFFAESLTRQVGEFVPGTDYAVSTVDGHKISTIICYESIFPNLVRQSVKRGSNLIVLITNDGWFGQSSAPYQHLRMGVVRAVENRRYMVRTANTGVSAIIDPYGRIEAKTPVGVRTILDGLVHFRSDRTFYTEYGDVFAYANVLTVILFLIWVIRQGIILERLRKSPKFNQGSSKEFR
jgi:apolipoprotein N-acyltransferase